MFAVIDKVSGAEISRHETAEEARRMILIYENADGVEGIYRPGCYDIREAEGKPVRKLRPLHTHGAVREASDRKAAILRILHRREGGYRCEIFPDGDQFTATVEAEDYEGLCQRLLSEYAIEAPAKEELTFVVSCGNGFAYAEIIQEQ